MRSAGPSGDQDGRANGAAAPLLEGKEQEHEHEGGAGHDAGGARMVPLSISLDSSPGSAVGINRSSVQQGTGLDEAGSEEEDPTDREDSWLRVLLVTLTLGVWCLVVWVILQSWEALDTPLRLPWSNRANSQLSGNVQVAPLTLLYMWRDLGYIASMGIELPREQQSGGVGGGGGGEVGVKRGKGAVEFLPPLYPGQPLHRPAGTTDLLWRFGLEVVAIVLGLTVYNLVFWLPSFVLDWFLFGKMSDSTLAVINTLVSITVFFIAARVLYAVMGACEKEGEQEEGGGEGEG